MTISSMCYQLETILDNDDSQKRFKTIDGSPVNSLVLKTRAFLKNNHEHLHLAKNSSCIRKKFKKISKKIEGLDKPERPLVKWLQSLSSEELPRETIQEIIQRVPLNSIQETKKQFLTLNLVSKSWSNIASKDLAERIQRYGLNIFTLCPLYTLPLIQKLNHFMSYLDITGLNVSFEDLKNIFQQSINIQFLKLKTSKIKYWESSLALLPNFNKITDLVIEAEVMEDFALPQNKISKLFIRAEEIHQMDLWGPALEKLTLKLNTKNDLDLPEIDTLKDLSVCVPMAESLSLPSYPALETLVINTNTENLSIPDLPELKSLVIISQNLKRLNLGKLPKLETLSLQTSTIEHLSHQTLYSNVKDLKIHANIQDLFLGNFTNLENLEIIAQRIGNFEIGTQSTLKNFLFITESSGDLNLDQLVFSNAQKITLGIPNVQNISFKNLKDLHTLILSQCLQLRSLTISNNPSLTRITCIAPNLNYFSHEGPYNELLHLEIDFPLKDILIRSRSKGIDEIQYD